MCLVSIVHLATAEIHLLTDCGIIVAELKTARALMDEYS
jgi:hypothetical protein